MNGFNTKVSPVEQSGQNNSQRAAALAVSTTYAELKALRDNNNLAPGTWYRITDYHTTVSPLITSVRSADHQFDVIVRADDATHLNENAYAALHEGDNYFVAAKLEAWELKYRIENEKWSKSSGTFVIESTDAYALKKIGTVDVEGTTYILWDASELYEGYGLTQAVSEDEEVGTDLMKYDPDTGEIDGDSWTSTIESKQVVAEDGKGTIYFMKDEHGNQCPYDFKNIQFKRWAVSDSMQGREGLDGKYMGVLDCLPAGLNIENEADFIWAYTFSSDADGSEDQMDYSLDGTHNVYANVMSDAPDSMTGLNDIVFFGEYNNGNRFGVNCYCNTFGNNNYSNSFGNDCYDNSFGNNCGGNTFGNDFVRNSFGNGCGSNTFGNSCEGNTFGNSFQNNSFGNNCGGNTFGNFFQNNTLGNGCSFNSFGNYCNNNSFGNGCNGNTFGNNCFLNTFGNDCYDNSFGNYIMQITVFDGVQFCSVTGGSGKSYVKNAQILNGTAGDNAINKLTITFTDNQAYTQVAAKNTSGTLKIWNPADLAN